ncbi:hypothetical protein BGZ83_003959 [Gryganskiella cystojenkinii]|nr:hypothetical protein BGZ83_003959 [Gryganskiella cystojenkinii]
MAETPRIKTRYEDIKDVPLTEFLNVSQETTFPAHTLWQEKPTVVIVIRRPGCQFCREEAQIFNAQRETFEQILGMRMVCIVHEKEGSDIFQRDFWKGQVYFDETKGFYKALGGGHLRTGGWGQLIRPLFWVNFVRNKRSGVEGNFEGNGHILGGLYVVAAGNNGIAYEHVEKVWGDIARVDHVLESCSRLSGVTIQPSIVDQAKNDRSVLEERMHNSPVNPANRNNVQQTSTGTAPTAVVALPASEAPVADVNATRTL